MIASVARNLSLALWHLLPANPILVRVVGGASRRVRHLWLRVGYLGALLAVVLFSLLASVRSEASLTDLAKGASQTFKWASTAQLALMCFLAPVFTASAITQERDAQTYNILISTPLSDAQIALGSLMSRLYFVIVLLLSGLPIFLMTMVYGGVTSRQVLASFMLCAATACITGALAIFVAMLGVGTRRTIFSFYLLIALYLLAVYMFARQPWAAVAAAPPSVSGVQMSWLAPLHPFLALEVALNEIGAPPMARLGEHGGIVQWSLAYPATAYFTWTMVASALLVGGAVFFVRRGAKTGELTWVERIAQRFRRGAGTTRTRSARHVWANPVAWREATTRNASGTLTRWTVILGGLAAALYVYVAGYLRAGWTPSDVTLWLGGLTSLQVAVALIVATNVAATSMTKEKESKTMELLLTTPLTPRYILWGKLRGLVSFASPLVAGPVVMLVLFGATPYVRDQSPPVVWIESAVQLGGLLLVFTALACLTGLHRSLSSRSNMTAVMSSVGIIILVCGAASLIGYSMVEASRGEFGAFLAPFTPFTAIRYLTDPAALSDAPNKGLGATETSIRTAMLLGSAIAVTLYAVVVWRWYAGLVNEFDRTMRKQSAI